MKKRGFNYQAALRLLAPEKLDAYRATTTTSPPLKYHGGKHYMARRIIDLMPTHLHYVEPFAGGLAVLLAKDPEGVSEVVNDIDGELANFWRVLQQPDDFDRFRRRVEATPFSESEWIGAAAHDQGDAVEDAVAFFVRCRQSLAGRGRSFAPISRRRTRRGMNEQASAWLTTVDGLATVHARLSRVVILDRPALDVIRQQDGPDTLFYLDPPYLAETRAAADVYGFEISEQDHRELLHLVRDVTGKVMVSGYRSALYDTMLADWTRHDFDLPNNAAGGREKRRMTECVWTNY